MKYNMYSVYDSKVEAYAQPIFMRTHGEAIRSFESACNNEQHEFSKHASDYTLFHIGSYDDSDATFECNMTPIPLAKAHEVVARLASAA